MIVFFLKTLSRDDRDQEHEPAFVVILTRGSENKEGSILDEQEET